MWLNTTIKISVKNNETGDNHKIGLIRFLPLKEFELLLLRDFVVNHEHTVNNKKGMKDGKRTAAAPLRSMLGESSNTPSVQTLGQYHLG